MDRLNVPGKSLWIGDQHLVTCEEAGLDSDYFHLFDAVSEEMLNQAVRDEGGELKMLGYTTHIDTALFLEDSHAKPPELWVSLASRLHRSCDFPATTLTIYPLEPDLAPILVPYYKSRSAAPHKKRDLLLKSKRLYQKDRRYTPMIDALRECELVDYDEMLAEFQSL